MLILAGEVNEAMFRNTVRYLAAHKNEDIDIVLNTEGGDFFFGIGIYELLRRHNGDVTILGVGAVMSAGVFILLAGTVRQLTTHTTVMVHYGQDGAESKQENHHNHKLEKMIRDIFATKTSASKNRIATWHKADTFMLAAEAVRYGLADEVI